MLPQGWEMEAKRDHDWAEATADGPPEVPEPQRVVKRPPTQNHVRTPLEAKQESKGAKSPSKGNDLGWKPPKTGASKRERDGARAEDAEGATADRTPGELGLYRAVWGPLTKGRRDPTLNAERLTPEAYGRMTRGHPGREEGKGRSCGRQERPREEDYCIKHPAPDYQEDAPEVGWQTNPVHGGQEAAWIQAHAGPEAICPPSYPQNSRPLREAQQPGGGKQLQGP